MPRCCSSTRRALTAGRHHRRRGSPDRARRTLEIALLVGSTATVIAISMFSCEDTQPGSKSILLEDHDCNLSVILTVVGVVSLGFYAFQVSRDRVGAGPGPADVDVR